MTLPTAAVIRTNYLPSITGSGEDTKIGDLIAAADRVLAAWCGFPKVDQATAPTLEASTYTHFLDGPSPIEPRRLQLPVRPVASVTSIHDDYGRTWDYDSDDLVASTDYTLDEVEGAVYLHHDSVHGSWSASPRVIKVIYSAGYDTGADDGITKAIGALVAHWWQQRNTEGIETTTMGDTTITPVESEIPPHVRQIMWAARLPEAGMG